MMKCSVHGCQGRYEPKFILHTVKQGTEILVFNQVPAEVCNLCGDTLLKPETVRHLEKLLRQRKAPEKMVPLVEYV